MGLEKTMVDAPLDPLIPLQLRVPADSIFERPTYYRGWNMEPYYHDPLHDTLDAAEKVVERWFDPQTSALVPERELVDRLAQHLNGLESSIEGTTVPLLACPADRLCGHHATAHSSRAADDAAEP
jgi:hypothetical protein